MTNSAALGISMGARRLAAAWLMIVAFLKTGKGIM